MFPLLLLTLALIQGGSESVLGINSLLFGAMIIAAGFVVYRFVAKLQRCQANGAAVENVEAA